MSDNKFTQGKWKLHKHAFCCVVSDESQLLIANCGGRTSSINADELIAEQQANALLISKSPEMLEMLQRCKQELINFKFSFGQGSELEYEIGKLIKEATEL